jgi:heme/copper-type cytochrome/quinol oxidase subunit 2
MKSGRESKLDNIIIVIIVVAIVVIVVVIIVIVIIRHFNYDGTRKRL